MLQCYGILTAFQNQIDNKKRKDIVLKFLKKFCHSSLPYTTKTFKNIVNERKMYHFVPGTMCRSCSVYNWWTYRHCWWNDSKSNANSVGSHLILNLHCIQWRTLHNILGCEYWLFYCWKVHNLLWSQLSCLLYLIIAILSWDISL
jgi:hypothetical protein